MLKRTISLKLGKEINKDTFANWLKINKSLLIQEDNFFEVQKAIKAGSGYNSGLYIVLISSTLPNLYKPSYIIYNPSYNKEREEITFEYEDPFLDNIRLHLDCRLCFMNGDNDEKYKLGSLFKLVYIKD